MSNRVRPTKWNGIFLPEGHPDRCSTCAGILRRLFLGTSDATNHHDDHAMSVKPHNNIKECSKGTLPSLRGLDPSTKIVHESCRTTFQQLVAVHLRNSHRHRLHTIQSPSNQQIKTKQKDTYNHFDLKSWPALNCNHAETLV